MLYCIHILLKSEAKNRSSGHKTVNRVPNAEPHNIPHGNIAGFQLGIIGFGHGFFKKTLGKSGNRL